MAINYHGRQFRPVSNSPTGQVNAATVFHYQQPFQDELLTATYQGGGIRHGSMTGLVSASDGSLRFYYQHVTDAGELRAGHCESTPEILPDGRVRLYERWQWTGGGGSGESVVEEVLPDTAIDPRSETWDAGGGGT